jgi:zinc and cadmium transporter
MLLPIILASLVGSVIAMSGGALLLYKEKWAKKISLMLVSFAAGGLLGTAFFELIPEALEESPQKSVMISLVGGFLVFFIIEKILRWYHCHDLESCEVHTFSSTVILGDAIHNALDGIAISASFMIGGVSVGVATTIAVFLHEVPQEIGDFGVLLHAGYSKKKVFFYNFLAALATPTGALLGYFALPFVEEYLGLIIAFTAGTFLYISASDLIPEVHRRANARDIRHIIMFFAGILIVLLIDVFL